MNDGPIDRTVYFYDPAGRHIRIMQLRHDGTQTVLEACSYDADGRKTKVRFLFSREADSECGAGNACGASTGYGIEASPDLSPGSFVSLGPVNNNAGVLQYEDGDAGNFAKRFYRFTFP